MKILLRNGKIADGSGGAPFFADLLVEGDRIARIGQGISDEQADKVIDCEGLCLAPGFIDAHSHNDWFAARRENDRFFAPFIEQGITTQVTGNCGFSPFGFDPETKNRQLLGSGLFTMGNIEGETASLSDFGKAVVSLPLNIVPLYGHMSGRIGISGYDSRALTEKELLRLDELIDRTLSEGAAGLSFGLMYEPDRYAPYEELKRAAEIVSRHGKILTVHGRANSSVSTSYSPPFGGRPHNLRALDEMVRLAHETGVKLQHSHLIFVGEKSWKTVDEALDIIERARAEGLSLGYDSYSLMCGVSVITVILPAWYLTLPEEKRKSRLTRLRLALEIGVTKKLLGFGFEDITVTWAGAGQEELAGKTVSEIARLWSVSELDAYIKIIELSEGRGRVLMHRYLTKDILLRLMKDEACLFMTDAWVEEEGRQNPACFMCMPMFFKLARENGMALEKVVSRMTKSAAERFCIKDRGLLKEGYFADITVFDERAIAPGASGEGRPEGIAYVLINGELAVENGSYVKGGAGRMLLQK